MSTTPTPFLHPLPAGVRPAIPQPDGTDLNRVAVSPVDRTAQRRASIERGRGLEILGHAIEYLIDSRMHWIEEPHTRADSEATQILMRLSRQIFHERIDGPSPAGRLRLWITERLTVPAA